MGRWGEYGKTAASSGGGGGLWLKVVDGESVNVIFLGEPMIKYSYWDGSSYQPCEPDHESVRTSFLINTFDIDAGELKLMELNAPTFEDVCDELEMAKAPDREVVRIKRTGTGPRTRYKVRAMDPAPAKLLGALSAAEADLRDLSEFGGLPMPGPAAGPAAGTPDEDIPF